MMSKKPVVHQRERRPNTMTNPLDQDPVLKDLLKKLDRIETRRGFAKWKRIFLQQFESHLEGVSITKAGQKYHGFAKRLDRLVLLLKAFEKLISTGDLSPEKVTVQSRKALSELQKQLTGIISHLQMLVPGTLEQEITAGYTKFDMGAVLVRDGFVEYDRLCLCRDVLWHMRSALLVQVADRQLLEEMERYKTHLDVFCGIMGEDLGLHKAMLKCRDILRAEDDEFLKYEQGKDKDKSPGPTPLQRRTFTSEFDQESEHDDEEEEDDDEEEEESESDEDDDDEEEEEDDETSSDESGVVEIYGMEIPLRLTQAGAKYFDDSDNVSDISDDSSWSWQLQIPEPPRKQVQKVKAPPKGMLPSAPLLLDDDDDDDDDTNAKEDHSGAATDPPDHEHDEEDDTHGDSKHHDDDEDDDDDDDEDETVFTPGPMAPPVVAVVRPPRVAPPPPTTAPPRGMETTSNHKKTAISVPDAEPTAKLEWKMGDYYHGGDNPQSWKIAKEERKKTVIDVAAAVESEDDDGKASVAVASLDASAESAPSGEAKKKIILKARLRRKTPGGSSDSISDDGTKSLDSVVLRGTSARRGGKKSTTSSLDSPGGGGAGAESVGSSGSKGTELSDGKSVGSQKNDLDNVIHRRKVQRHRSSGSASASTSSRNSEMRRMARAARKAANGGGGGSSDDASTGSRRSRRSAGSRKSVGSRRSVGSRSRSGGGGGASSSRKKDPLHNLLFKKSPSTIVVHHNNHKDLAGFQGSSGGGGGSGDEKNGVAPQPPAYHPQQHEPPRHVEIPVAVAVVDRDEPSPRRSRRPVVDDIVDFEDGQSERRRLIYTWYGRLGQPTRDAFKRRIRGGDMGDDTIQEDDVDLLPWIHNGARININAMSQLLRQ